MTYIIQLCRKNSLLNKNVRLENLMDTLKAILNYQVEE